MAVYNTLREANAARQAEWDTGGNIDLSYAGNELAGEVSEALAEATIEGGPDLRDLAKELADVIICIDLIAIRAGIDPDPVEHAPIGELSRKPQMWVNEIASDLQHVCNTIKKMERERHGMPGSRASIDELTFGLWLVQFGAVALAECYEIDLDVAVAAKFNATSEKVGLATRLEYA